MLNKEEKELLTRQIQKSFESAYLYLEMSIYFQGTGLEVFTQSFIKQADEEIAQGIKILTYLQNCNGNMKLLDIPESADSRSYSTFIHPLNKTDSNENLILSDKKAVRRENVYGV